MSIMTAKCHREVSERRGQACVGVTARWEVRIINIEMELLLLHGGCRNGGSERGVGSVRVSGEMVWTEEGGSPAGGTSRASPSLERESLGMGSAPRSVAWAGLRIAVGFAISGSRASAQSGG